MTEPQEQGARLEQLIKALNENQTSMAQRVGISQGYMSQMITGSRSISKKILQFIAKNLPTANVRWLMTGEGEMFLEQKTMPDGILDPQVMEDDVEYGLRNGGIFEDLSARVRALEDAVRELRDKMDGMEDGKGA